MIRLIEALNYRCLHYVRQPLADFQVLVGPNASGKSTFLDAVAFLGDLLDDGLEQALLDRSSDFRDLLFMHQGDRFELAVELAIPEDRRRLLPDDSYERVRYEVAIGAQAELEEIHIFEEQVLLLPTAAEERRERTLFPLPIAAPETIITPTRKPGTLLTARKNYEGNDNFYSELRQQKSRGGWAPSFRLGPRKSTLGNMPEDVENFPVTTWLRSILIDGTQHLRLNSQALGQASAPGQGRLFRPDGANLPWVVNALREEAPHRHRDWVGHVQTALPDLRDIGTVERPDTRHRFLQLVYADDLSIPSWMASDGTLRLLALTLPAYLPDFEGIYLIEEPENGIHPTAMETVYQSLSSVYSAQILMATHSPIVLGCAAAVDVLCFKKDDRGATDIVRGDGHPALRDWQGEIDLSVLYASGVLG